MKKPLLLSNSTMPSAPYLNWPKEHIRNFLGEGIGKVLFIPYAGVTITYDEYTKAVATVLEPMSFSVTGIHTSGNEAQAVQQAEAIVIGGGNTFRQLQLMYEKGIVEAIREKAETGIPVMGWSADSNVCCPTIKTTNDMPIAFLLSMR
jgi:dipeptidase E